MIMKDTVTKIDGLIIIGGDGSMQILQNLAITVIRIYCSNTKNY